MTVGEKIKKIRTFRGMTQKELGSMLRMGSRGADNRIAQYETNYRVPKAELLDEIAGALNVNPQNFYDPVPDSLDAFIYRLLWLEEDFPGYIHLFQLERCPGDRETENEPVARYEDGKNWPVYPPVGMYFDGELVGDFLREWLLRQRQLAYGEITHDQYFAWKINWPDTSDRCADSIHYMDWRK